MYDWDPRKSDANRQKHGISFDEARDSVFNARNVLVPGVAHSRGEDRHAVIGKHKEKYYVAIFTFTSRGIRIISVRRARPREKEQAVARGI